MKRIALIVGILLLLTGCGKHASEKKETNHTDNSSKTSTAKPKHTKESKQTADKQAKTDISASSEDSSESHEDSTSSSSPVIGEKQPTISETVANLPSEYLGTWENHNNGDYYKITETQIESGSGVGATISDISKVGKDHEGYLVQTVDGRSYYFTLRENKLYPLTSQGDLSSDVANQMIFEKTSN